MDVFGFRIGLKYCASYHLNYCIRLYGLCLYSYWLLNEQTCHSAPLWWFRLCHASDSQQHAPFITSIIAWMEQKPVNAFPF